MDLNFNNLNSLWAGVMIETLAHLGLRAAVVCPGSRNTPLTVALARHPKIKTTSILDERSAAFYGLGLAKAAGLPTVLVCTSGTAGANFYPAIIEATQSAVPLIVLTGDRPPELRDCHSGQTIDQIKLFGSFVQWFSEMATPLPSLGMLRYARQTMVQAWRHAQWPQKGVVHLNCPFRDPLAPIADDSVEYLKSQIPANFFTDLSPFSTPSVISAPQDLLEAWQSVERGLIIAGVDQPNDPELYCLAIARLANQLNFPVLAEALSPVRNYAHLFPQGLMTTYDYLLRESTIAARLKPDRILQFGACPTSKMLRQWLAGQAVPSDIFNNRADNFDPLHRPSQHHPLNLSTWLTLDLPLTQNPARHHYCRQWQELQQKAMAHIQGAFKQEAQLHEGAIAYYLSRYLPSKTTIFFANSMAVRYAEFFWQPNHCQYQPFFNRGANGIDGTLSTALGIAVSQQSPTVLLTGDLALLHDTNGFLSLSQFQGSLIIIVINNDGGGIFSLLPIQSETDVFEEYFATPQGISLAALCETYHVPYQRLETHRALIDACQVLPQAGVRLFEVRTQRQEAIAWLIDFFESGSQDWLAESTKS